MCGLVGVVTSKDVGVCLYDTLTVLQHRGQDAAGIMTDDGGKLNLRKNNGLIKDVFRTRHMRGLTGKMGIGHVRLGPLVRSSNRELLTNHRDQNTGSNSSRFVQSGKVSSQIR